MAYKVPHDGAVLSALQHVLARLGSVQSQARLGELVRHQLRRRDEALTVSDARVRRLAVDNALVRVEVATGTTDRPAPTRCPVCSSTLDQVANRTLDGEATVVGTRCPSCPYRTGPHFEVPLHYVFHARRAKVGAPRRAGPF